VKNARQPRSKARVKSNESTVQSLGSKNGNSKSEARRLARIAPEPPSTLTKEQAEEYTRGLGQVTGGTWRMIQLGYDLGVPVALGLTTKDWVHERLGGYVRLTIEERQPVVATLREEGYSTREIAGIVGVDHATVVRDAGANAPPDDAVTREQEVESGANAPPTRTSRERIAKALFDKAAAWIPKGELIRCGDFRELSREIPDDSVDLVFTDPPYSKDAIELFDGIGDIAARILKPGGSLVSYVGNVQLPEAINILNGYLRYWVVLVCLHNVGGPFGRMRDHGVILEHKLMLWYVKDTRADKHTLIRSVIRGQREKNSHQWQQSSENARYLIERLSPEGGLVVDFLAGSGTTVRAALELGRHVVAYELNPRTAKRANAHAKTEKQSKQV